MSLKLRRNFTRTAVSVAIASMVGVSTVYAQDADVELTELEEVVVTGVRSSLSRSLDTKRNAKALVDSIAAEELGRFPDDNVADSLAHIPGVSVSRNRSGEADSVNIRGLGPEFSVVTLNNRILATDDTGRNFAFDVLPSEVISGADVWKTVEAKRVEGSIGGAINLTSIRPLNNPGLHGAVSVNGDFNSLSEEYGSKITGVISNTFADDTFGVVVSVTSESGTQRADDLFDNFFSAVPDGYSYDVDGNGAIEGVESALVVPGSYALGAYESEFERNGVAATFQWQPSDRIELTADILVTELNADSTGFTQSFFLVDETEDPLARDRYSNIVLDGNVITGFDVSDVTAEVVTLDDHRTVDTTLFALNGKFQVTDNLSLTADVYRSESERLSGGQNTFVVAGNPGAHSGRFELNEGGLPTYIPSFVNADGSIPAANNPRTFNDFGNSDFGPHWAARDGDDVRDIVTGFTLEGELDLELASLTTIDFGVAFTTRDKTKDAFDNFENDNACNYCGYPFAFSDVGANVVREFPFDNLFEGEAGNIPRSFPIFDIPSYLAGVAAADGQTLTDFDGNERTFGANESALLDPIFNPVNSYDVSEDTTSFFVQANFEGNDWFANLGVRYVETDITASFASSEILSIRVENPNSSNPSFFVDRTPSAAGTADGNYDKLLPAINFGKNLTESLLLRLSAAQSLSRPSLEQLTPLTTDNASSGVFTQAIAGNPNIEPVFSDQFDVGLEWYFSDDSVIYGSLFRKELDGFITTDTRFEEIAGRTFIVTQPINGDTAEVDGLEVGIQKFFDNGFGITASYALTDSSTVIDGEDAGDLPGVADKSYSLSFIYEKNRLSAQVSLDFTDELVVDAFSPLDGPSDDSFETTLEEISMVTASLRYNINDNAEIFLEGINLLNESNRTFQGRSDLPGSIQVYGRTINFGARYSF